VNLTPRTFFRVDTFQQALCRQP